MGPGTLSVSSSASRTVFGNACGYRPRTYSFRIVLAGCAGEDGARGCLVFSSHAVTGAVDLLGSGEVSRGGSGDASEYIPPGDSCGIVLAGYR